MEATDGERGGSSRYSLKPSRINNEDILFCVDVNPESSVEIKTTGSNGRHITRMDSMKQAILLFVHAKLSMNPEHRFAFTTIAKSAIWHKKEFSSDITSAEAAIRALGVTASSSHADLTSLFRLAAHEARKSTAQNRILRVVLIYCRSSTQPQYQWAGNQKVFTLDIIYLHEKPGPDNCPQEVYDALVDAIDEVSQHESYIFESGLGVARVLYRFMCLLLSHPQQRISLDDLDIPKPLAKKLPPADSAPATEVVPVTSQ